MTIRRYNRVYWNGDPIIDFHRNLCYCSGHKCGATIKKPRTTGYTIYLWKYALHIGEPNRKTVIHHFKEESK